MIDYLLFTGRTDCVRACSFGLAGGGAGGGGIAVSVSVSVSSLAAAFFFGWVKEHSDRISYPPFPFRWDGRAEEHVWDFVSPGRYTTAGAGSRLRRQRMTRKRGREENTRLSATPLDFFLNRGGLVWSGLVYSTVQFTQQQPLPTTMLYTSPSSSITRRPTQQPLPTTM